ncbi:mitochondrial inner membrane protein required for protein import [Ascochyta lentis]
MLPRAAFHALRTRPGLAASRTAALPSTTQWTRAYAKVGRPKTNLILADEQDKTRPTPSTWPSSPSSQRRRALPRPTQRPPRPPHGHGHGHGPRAPTQQ